jgi:hypothetical protein
MNIKAKLVWALGAAMTAGAIGCSDDDTTNPDASVAQDAAPRPDATVFPDAMGQMDAGGPMGCPAWAGTQPADTVAVNFTIDDSANQTYTATDGLAWKGSMNYDMDTRCAVRDPSWGGGTGPYALLYDDGPWNAGGHEPMGATAGDSIFGVTVFVPTSTNAQNFEYGAVRNWSAGQQGDWIWQGPNGTFTIPASSTAPVTATGLVIAAFGDIDVLFEIDTSTLAPEFSGFNPANGVRLKSSAWGWTEIDTEDDGTLGDRVAADGVFSMQLGMVVGRPPLRHSGLLRSGDEAQFVYVLGGVEYKVGGVPPVQGISVYTRVSTSTTWVPAAVTNKPDGDRNTFITVP